MANNILPGATNHFEFKELPNSKIILSEQVYIRLLGDVNLCAFSGSKDLEYGTFLYGKEIKPNIIYFDIPSKNDDYIPLSREFDINGTKMYEELINNIEYSKYDSIAHIHTHPYIGGTCRYFSNQDLMTIKHLQEGFQPSNGQKKYFFGGLLTVSPLNIGTDDEISFVYYDEKSNNFYKITNITVLNNNEEITFPRKEGQPKLSI